MVMTLSDAFLLGWRSAREVGQIAYAKNPKISPHAIFAEMTMPEREAILEYIMSNHEPVENKPLSELVVG